MSLDSESGFLEYTLTASADSDIMLKQAIGIIRYPARKNLNKLCVVHVS